MWSSQTSTRSSDTFSLRLSRRRYTTSWTQAHYFLEALLAVVGVTSSDWLITQAIKKPVFSFLDATLSSPLQSISSPMIYSICHSKGTVGTCLYWKSHPPWARQLTAKSSPHLKKYLTRVLRSQALPQFTSTGLYQCHQALAVLTWAKPTKHARGGAW